MDLLRLRRPDRRGHGRPDLPDELARGVRVRPRELGRQRGHRRGRGAAREDPRDPRSLPAARARDPHDRQGRRRDLARTSSSSAARALGRRLAERYESVRPDDICTFIYTSGTTGPPKGCVISHGNYRAMLDMVVEKNVLGDEDELTYLFLPLAHSFALLIQFGNFELGSSIAYWERDPLRIVPNLSEVKPTYFPSVPRIFEKIYTAATAAVEKEGGAKKKIFDWSIGVGKTLPRGRALRRRRRAPERPAQAGRPPRPPQDPQPLRRQPAGRRHRRGADQPGHPALLRRRRRARARGLGHDRDLDGRDDRDARTTSSSARSASRSPASR